MLEGKDPALCYPGCDHQPVISLEAPSCILSYWHHPPHMAYTTNFVWG